MYPLVESIRIENRQLHHVELHNQRINKARQAVYGLTDRIAVEEIIKLPSDLSSERYKCRITFYPDHTEYTILPYHQREINTLKVVYDDTIDYTYKNENRQQLDAAYNQRGNCDDVIIVKNGYITDSWAANILFYDGKKWITPNTPLLKGTQREYLLQGGLIEERSVMIDDLYSYQKIRLINAMIDFERSSEITIKTSVFF